MIKAPAGKQQALPQQKLRLYRPNNLNLLSKRENVGKERNNRDKAKGEFWE